MEKQEIKKLIILDLEKAWMFSPEASYWLEKLPMIDYYDAAVQDLINSLKFAIKNRDREYFDATVDELIDHYYNNRKKYNFE